MTKVVTMYHCGICNQAFADKQNAQQCEAQGRPESVQVGNIVLARSGFGWFNGLAGWVENKARVGRDDPCPNGDTNCFASCCTYQFYYVVSHIDGDSQNAHRARYHLVTAAMKKGYRTGYTYDVGHCTMRRVEHPPAAVVKKSRTMLDERAKCLL